MCAQVEGNTRKGRTVRTKIVERWRDFFLRKSLKVSGSSNTNSEERTKNAVMENVFFMASVG